MFKKRTMELARIIYCFIFYELSCLYIIFGGNSQAQLTNNKTAWMIRLSCQKLFYLQVFLKFRMRIPIATCVLLSLWDIYWLVVVFPTISSAGCLINVVFSTVISFYCIKYRLYIFGAF